MVKEIFEQMDKVGIKGTYDVTLKQYLIMKKIEDVDWGWCKTPHTHIGGILLTCSEITDIEEKITEGMNSTASVIEITEPLQWLYLEGEYTPGQDGNIHFIDITLVNKVPPERLKIEF